jgi:carotenoid cleavage dioxygenase-like enzyme
MNEQLEEPAYRYLYAVGGGEQSETRGGRPLVKHDLATGACERRELGDRQLAGAFLFVPDPERRRAEDGGWLVGVVDDEAGAASSVSVLDAADLTGAALSHIHLPRRVRRSLRGLWVPASNDTT